jgi:hypothetical protein
MAVWRAGDGAAKSHLFEVIRHYTLFDRRAAPQYYPPTRRHEQNYNG